MLSRSSRPSKTKPRLERNRGCLVILLTPHFSVTELLASHQSTTESKKDNIVCNPVSDGLTHFDYKGLIPLLWQICSHIYPCSLYTFTAVRCISKRLSPTSCPQNHSPSEKSYLSVPGSMRVRSAPWQPSGQTASWGASNIT